MKCRHCDIELVHTFIDLGSTPPSNAYLTDDDLNSPETYYPLKIKVCDCCWLVQTEDYAQADELFSSDYAYFSSTSMSWLEHAANYTKKVISLFKLNQDSFVIEVASNDGYLLKNFVEFGVPCLGIEPTDSTADAAEKIGIQVVRKFFGESLGRELTMNGKQADLIVGNNVYAHVPDINDFTLGLKAVLKLSGTITLEFPHLMCLIEHTQFDTIYHEHFSYLSLYTVSKIFMQVGLRIWNVEELTTHGGSLRIYGCHAEDMRETQSCVNALLLEETKHGLQDLTIYKTFQDKANKIKNNLLTFLIEKNHHGELVVAYGAAAKGNTLLNYAGVKPDLLQFVCDAAKAKQKKFMPGSRIPILPLSALTEQSPDYVLILPWNIVDEVRQQNSFLEDSGCKFVIAIPELVVLD